MIAPMTDIVFRRGSGYWLAPALLLLVLSCSGAGARGPRSGGTPAAVPGSQPATQPVSLHITVDQLKKSDKDLPRARPLPTISAIDFTAFPAVASGAYGKSKKQVLVKPGKPGVIAEALAAARAGDTILLEQGVYREGEDGDDGALRITKPGIVLRTLPGKRARILPRAAGTKRGVLISADNVMVHGLSLEGFTSTGVAIGREGATVRGVIISEVTIKAGRGDWVDGIVVWPNNQALKKPASDGLLIRNVTIEDATLGVSCGAGPCKSWWMENVRIRNRAGAGGGADAVAVEDGKDVVLVNVTASRASADGVDLKATGVLLLNVHVSHVGGNGLHLWRGGDVVNTLVHHTGGDGAVVLHSGRYRLLNSTVALHRSTTGANHCLTAGRGKVGASRVELINSIFFRSSGGVSVVAQEPPQIHNCLFFDLGTGPLLAASIKGRELTVKAPRKGALKRLGLGRNNLFLDPRFSAPGRGDFRLPEGSPAVDAGCKTKPSPLLDMVGNPRERGAAPDLGPYEQH